MKVWVITACVIAGCGLVFLIIRSIVRKIRDNLLGGITASDIAGIIHDAKEEEQCPEPRTVFGATDLFMNQILKDFPDFHYKEVESSVKIFLYEMLSVKYEGKSSFTDSVVIKGLEKMIDVSPEHSDVRDETVHKIAISNYVKTKEYNTIVFQAAVGYSVNGKRCEERYKVEYSLLLYEHDVSKKNLTCKQCGGPIASTGVTVCPFCGTGFLWDTKVAWQFSSVDLS